MNLKLVVLFFQAVVLVAGFLRDQQAKGIGREQALKEIKEAFDARIDRAVSARRQPDDPGVAGVRADDPTQYRD